MHGVFVNSKKKLDPRLVWGHSPGIRPDEVKPRCTV